MLRRLAAVVALAVSAGVQAQSCTFNSAGSPLNFPSLNPSAATTVTASMNIDVRCVPAGVSPTWGFSGTNGSAPLRMMHATQNVFIPYTITATFVSGSGANETWRITGTLLGANYVNAPEGAYSDILTATVTP